MWKLLKGFKFIVFSLNCGDISTSSSEMMSFPKTKHSAGGLGRIFLLFMQTEEVFGFLHPYKCGMEPKTLE